MVKAILSFAIAVLAVMTVVASAAETENENSTISTALLNTDEAIETEEMPEDETIALAPVEYAGKNSPLVVEVTADGDGRFDITIPAASANLN